MVEVAGPDPAKAASALRRALGVIGNSVRAQAVAWVLRRPEVTAAIVGARRPDQVDVNVLASGWWLSLAELAQIDRHLAELGL